jgi:hypothetical protein
MGTKKLLNGIVILIILIVVMVSKMYIYVITY